MKVVFHGHLGKRTGYQIHATGFTNALAKLVPVVFEGDGDVHISLIDSVSIQNVNERLPYPSILYNVFESTEQPSWFMERLKYFDQLWTASEWQRSCLIAQGVPEEFVKTVPEGVDPEIYKPEDSLVQTDTFDFVHVGQWQPRKSTQEICEAFIKAFPDNQNVRLYLSADTLFPSDEFKSTEERLKAYELEDARIIPVHFEEKADYIKRLQSAHVFVSCARSEGWSLPLCEAMACGIPSITSDWGGTTEYANDAIKVNVPMECKPVGIYGDWNVPGVWGEPDYDHLVECMQDVYKNYDEHKKKALETSKYIRTKFSWESAAKRAVEIINEFPTIEVLPTTNHETEIRSFARGKGYEILSLQKRKVIFTVDSHPSTPERMATLLETVKQIKDFGYPVLVAAHLPLSDEVLKEVDYFVYDKRDILSGEDRPVYWRINEKGEKEEAKASIPCHALAATHNVRNAWDFCKGKYDWIYHMSSDVEVDLELWLSKVHASDKQLIGSLWNNEPNTFGGQLIAGKTEIMDKIMPHLETWDDFVSTFGEDRFCSERGLYKIVEREVGFDNVEFVSLDMGNRFDQVDHNAFKDDQMQLHFCDGAFVNIAGNSGKEYEVTYSNPVDGNDYTLKQKAGMWSSTAKKFFRKWTVSVKYEGKLILEHTMDLTGKKVLISFGSKALGDTMAWIPYIDEFRKKHNCKVVCSTWWNTILDYPEIEFVIPGTATQDIYAAYEIGCFDEQPDKNPNNWRTTTLQKVSADILGIDYEPIRAKLKYEPKTDKTKPYICFSEFSTMKNKFWNREGAWQKVINHLNELGYDCVSISVEPTQLEGVIKHNGQSVEQTLSDLSGADFYVGLNHGPSWLAYSMGLPVILITGVSEPFNDFPTPYRLSTNDCQPCFNNPAIPIDRGWDWCVNEDKYICTRNITEEMVFEAIDKIRKDIDG